MIISIVSCACENFTGNCRCHFIVSTTYDVFRSHNAHKLERNFRSATVCKSTSKLRLLEKSSRWKIRESAIVANNIVIFAAAIMGEITVASVGAKCSRNSCFFGGLLYTHWSIKLCFFYMYRFSQTLSKLQFKKLIQYDIKTIKY